MAELVQLALAMERVEEVQEGYLAKVVMVVIHRKTQRQSRVTLAEAGVVGRAALLGCRGPVEASHLLLTPEILPGCRGSLGRWASTTSGRVEAVRPEHLELTVVAAVLVLLEDSPEGGLVAM